MSDPLRLLHEEQEALASVLQELQSSSWKLDWEDPDPTRYLRTISERLPEIAAHLSRYTESIASVWSDIRQSNERLLALIDVDDDADLSLVRQRQTELLQIQEMMRKSRDNFEALRTLFDFVWAISQQSVPLPAIEEVSRACQSLSRALEAADSHASDLLAAYDALHAGSNA